MGEVVALGRHLSGGLDIDQIRRDGYVALDPLSRQVAIEFVSSGHTLRQIAADLAQPLADVKKAFNNPITRAFISDLQAEMAQHKIINAAWVEQQVLKVWPQLTGEEDVNIVTMKGEQFSARKFHSAEVTSILKHFSGNADQKAGGGVKVVINFGDMGVEKPQVVIEGEVVGGEQP